ncbi:uncharacterized protein LOC135805969 [Sycon ciliatum]|uniref:uncharacterized protein LOC135805969 n=1 Tax=Sycon ciliatum TaxID=27933 RepID=UPI0031F6F95D
MQLNELKICKAMEQESVEHVPCVLDSVLVDVWEAAVLPMLSLADIFQLCGVTRRVRELLHTEDIFRRLCQNRYQISPCLDRSYILVAEHLWIATSVSSIHKSTYWRDAHCVVDSDDCHDQKKVFARKDRMIVQLSGLALMPPTTRDHTIIRMSPPESEPLIKTLWLLPEGACSYLPDLSTSLLDEQCRVRDEEERVSLGAATSLLLDNCGSHEEYQTRILDKLERDIPATVSYVPYVNRSCRLVELAKCFESLARSDPELLLSLRCENLIPTLPQHITTRWTYNPYDYLFIDINEGHLLGHDTLATQNWINFTVKLAELHSLLKLVIKGILRVSQLEDYFVAVMEYDELWQSLSESSRPSREILYCDLGSYLLSTLPTSQSEKELTKEELLSAMEQCGKPTVVCV